MVEKLCDTIKKYWLQPASIASYTDDRIIDVQMVDVPQNVNYITAIADRIVVFFVDNNLAPLRTPLVAK